MQVMWCVTKGQFDLVFTHGAFILTARMDRRVVAILNNILLINPSAFPPHTLYKRDEEKSWKRIFSRDTSRKRSVWRIGLERWNRFDEETWTCLAHTYTQSCTYFSPILCFLTECVAHTTYRACDMYYCMHDSTIYYSPSHPENRWLVVESMFTLCKWHIVQHQWSDSPESPVVHL